MKTEFDYYYGAEAEQFSFVRVPKVLFTDKEHFGSLSNDARILYGFLLERMSLSRKNHWIDAHNRVYIIFPIDEIAEIMGVCHEKALNILKELDEQNGIGLVKKKRRGLGLPSILYELIEKCNSKTLCPKQVTDENRVIPYQLYYHELSMIIDKASAYLDFLNKTEDGISVKQKILTLMKFRIPYFVGPLVKRNETDNVWIVRKAEGRIYPWNFENMVDFDKSEDGFIRRMTCKCTYLAGEDVLPKYSLLYSKYTVLNEINNIKVNGEKISPELKQDIFNELFMKTSRVTVKKITELLKRKGAFSEEKGDSLSGVDINIKSSLKSYLDFRRLLENGSLSENDVERIIERITVTTDKPRLVSWLKAEYSDLPAEDIRYISRLSYKDYGRLSAKLLTGCYELDTNTGEIGGRSIIDFMWAENINLMQILSDSYGYKSFIEEENKKYYMINPTGSIAQTLREMYVSPSVSRAIIRTMEIVKELRKITKKDPDKIFVEMARGGKPEEKGKRTSSRREQIEKLYDSAKAFVSDEDISHMRSQLGSLSDFMLFFNQMYRSRSGYHSGRIIM